MTFKIIYLNTYFREDVEIIILFNVTALYEAVIKENVEIVKLLLSNDKINVNAISILNTFFHKVSNFIFQLHPKSYISMAFKIYLFQSHS